MKDYKVRDLTNDEIEKANKRLAEKVAYVQKKLDRRTLLEGLAEEASELSQAALKVIRAERLSKNYTPVSAYDAMQMLTEELNDVMTMAYMLGILPGVFYPSDKKTDRWVERLKQPPKQRTGEHRPEAD